MRTSTKITFVLALTLALCAAVLMNFVFVSYKSDDIADIAIAKDGLAVVAEYSGSKIEINMIDADGVIKYGMDLAREDEGKLVSILDMAVDAENNVYILKNYSDRFTGGEEYQKLDIYDMSKLFFKRLQSHSLRNEQGVSYRWVSISGSLTLMGESGNGELLTRQSFDLEGAMSKKAIAPKNEWKYTLAAKEGIYEPVVAGTGVAYISGSGKLFYVSETEPAREVYPNRVLEYLMYPIYISQLDAESVYMGEQESGDMLILSLADGTTNWLTKGSEPFVGLSQYAAKDIVRMSMLDQNNFFGVVKGIDGDRFSMVLSVGGKTSVIEEIRPSILKIVTNFVLMLVLMTAGIFIAFMLAQGLFNTVMSSRTLLIKLVFTTLPLLVVALMAFGIFSFTAYKNSIYASFEKQVEDEGNMLTALFGTDSFEEIEFPFHYSGEAYQYLIKQMNTRETYTRSAYYELGNLYTGVDNDLPCYFPFELTMNIDAIELYMQAAYTGVAQQGVLNDLNGERLVCVTPIGGTSGDTVYLLETGVLTKNIDQYTGAYLRSYVIVSVIFVITIGVILSMIFMRLLNPIGKIKDGLEEFAKGNRAVRLQNSSTDELADIIRVFNMMANDIDAQLYTLQRLSETYFRFIPQKVFRLLGKENLSDLELGSSVEKDYDILCVSLQLGSEHLNPEQIQQLTNRFFNIVNTVSDENGAVIFSDSSNLRRLKIICPSGADNAVEIALSALSRIDAHNAKSVIQNRLDVLFVLHKAKVYYGICGDEHRLVPTMLSGEIDFITEREELFRQLSSRLIVTEAAFEEVDSNHYFNRFIGYPEDVSDSKYGLYDFYDSSSPEITRLTNETKETFDKALSFYRQQRYYDAKNLFAVVLRENQYDNVARHYIFSCEKNLVE